MVLGETVQQPGKQRRLILAFLIIFRDVDAIGLHRIVVLGLSHGIFAAIDARLLTFSLQRRARQGRDVPAITVTLRQWFRFGFTHPVPVQLQHKLADIAAVQCDRLFLIEPEVIGHRFVVVIPERHVEHRRLRGQLAESDVVVQKSAIAVVDTREQIHFPGPLVAKQGAANLRDKRP